MYDFGLLTFDTIVPVNLKEQDAFHLTIEEYLLSLISMAEELVSHLIIGYNQLLQLGSWLQTNEQVPSGCELGHPGRLHASRADRKLHQGPVCWVPAAEPEE